MVFIYHFEGDSEFSDAARGLLAAAEDGRCRLVASVLSLMEVLVVPRRAGDEKLCRLYRDFFRAFPNLQLLDIGVDIVERAAVLRASHRFRTPDALHLATAMEVRADAFVTQDDRLRNVQGLTIQRLTELSV